MPDTTPNIDIAELSGPADPDAGACDQALANYRAQPTADNVINCVLAYANAAAARIGQLSDRLATAEAEITALKRAAAAAGTPRPERPRLRAGSPTIPTAPRGG